MNNLEVHLAKRLLPLILSNQCPVRFSFAGDAGRRLNCFIVEIVSDSKPRILVESIANRKISGREWDGSAYTGTVQIELDVVAAPHLFVRHYRRNATITFTGLWDLFWGRTICYPYLHLWLHGTTEDIFQSAYNKRKVVTKNRLAILRALLQLKSDGSDDISVISLLAGMYGTRYFAHPRSDDVQRRVQVYLDGLVDTGEVSHTHGKYSISGIGIRTIEEIEEQDRQHNSSVRVQWMLAAIAILTAIFAAAQANLVKFDPIWDFSTSKKTSAACLADISKVPEKGIFSN